MPSTYKIGDWVIQSNEDDDEANEQKKTVQQTTLFTYILKFIEKTSGKIVNNADCICCVYCESLR